MIQIPHVRAGVYRLTIYAEGVFGQYEQDNVEVKAGDGQDAPFEVNWTPESHGTSPYLIAQIDNQAKNYSG